MIEDSKIRNIIIIAHVDHGKTTLVDGLLKQSKAFRDNQAEMSQDLIMDSGDQERERGITITAKITSVNHDGYRINIIDTPGHADFSGEVERTINMADGCLLIVDAQEGPMPQTKYVLSKALASDLKPVVIINKIEKQGARLAQVKDELDNLFLELAVHESQLHYPTYYAISREGKAWISPPDDINAEADLSVIFEAIIKDIPAPKVDINKPLQMLVSALAWDSFNGKYAIGRINSGSLKEGDMVTVCKKDHTFSKAKIDKILISNGIGKVQIKQAAAGEIVQITGISNVQIGETIADNLNPEALPVIEVEEPTLKIYLGPNTSPFKGLEGVYSTSRQIGQRLAQELETNVGLRVEEAGIGFIVSGRGELHLSVLIESMRREGYEFEVGRPQVVTKQVDGQTHEPIEELIIEVPAEYVGAAQMELGQRRATFKEQFASDKGVTKLVYELPTRTLLGLRNTLTTATKGSVVMNNLLVGFKPLSKELPKLRNGAIVAFESGTTTPYALEMAESRGTCFVGPAVKVYVGQVVGLNKRNDDLEMNVCKAKHLTNMRSTSSDGTVQLTPPVILSLEECLDFIEKDELLEVTPKALRLRKSELDHTKRKRLQLSSVK
ncbi:MAG: translational GTPase TypA [Candidatus Saccharimonadales bacterium]